MKLIAKSYTWWTALDTQLQKLVNSCAACLETKNAKIKFSYKPWSQVHIDFVGPF